MTRDEALEALGIANTAQVHAAFRRLSVKCHPDSATPDAYMWERITQARDVLAAAPPKCAHCKGTGRTVVGNIKVFCSSCGGMGVSK